MCFVRNSLLTLCCATTLHKTTEALPHFLSPYLVDLLIQVGTLFRFHRSSQAAHVDIIGHNVMWPLQTGYVFYMSAL